MQYVQSKQCDSKMNMVHNGYRYCLQRKSKNKNTEYWICTSRRTCKAKAVILKGKLVEIAGEHTHPVDGKPRNSQPRAKKESAIPEAAQPSLFNEVEYPILAPAPEKIYIPDNYHFPQPMYPPHHHEQHGYGAPHQPPPPHHLPPGPLPHHQPNVTVHVNLQPNSQPPPMPYNPNPMLS